MLVFIDESGDAGFKVDSSSCLIMSMVIFDDYGHADAARTLIRAVGQQARIKPEFRFTNCSGATRDLFFSSLESCAFRVRGIVMCKENIYSHYLRNHPGKFYNYTLRQMITHHGLQQAKIRIDGNAKKEFLKEAKAYLRNQAPAGTIDNLKFLDSRNEPLIQLADMVTGAIARPYNRPDRSDAHRWRQMIDGKIENIWEFK
jgi:hypothetical protein